MDRIKAHCDLCGWHVVVHAHRHRPITDQATALTRAAGLALTEHERTHEPAATVDCG